MIENSRANTKVLYVATIAGVGQENQRYTQFANNTNVSITNVITCVTARDLHECQNAGAKTCFTRAAGTCARCVSSLSRGAVNTQIINNTLYRNALTFLSSFVSAGAVKLFQYWNPIRTHWRRRVGQACSLSTHSFSPARPEFICAHEKSALVNIHLYSVGVCLQESKFKI